MTALLKDAIKPNLVQTAEGTPAVIHGGPFASIAQGTNSIVGTKMALSYGKYVVTEAGFASDLGAEKFFDIKCVEGNLHPEAVVIVATIRALRHHGGAKKSALNVPSVEAVYRGLSNLEKHVDNIKLFGLHPLVVINSFPDDAKEEIKLVIDYCTDKGIKAFVSTAFVEGGEGSIDLAKEILQVLHKGENHFKPLFERDMPIEQKIHLIATKIYGARGVQYSQKAKKDLLLIHELGFDHMHVCMAKTPKSLSDDEHKVGRPSDFIVTVREIEIASGAGFIIPILGDIMRMPGLPLHPAAENIDIDDDGLISGLF